MIRWFCLDGDSPLFSEEYLSERERRVWQTFAYKKRKDEWLMGRCAAKALLQKCCQETLAMVLDPQQIVIDSDSTGAPLARQGDGGKPLPLTISLSHDQNRAICAMLPEAGQWLGADIESIKPMAPEMFHLFLSPSEQEKMESLPEPHRSRLAIRWWSLKEAVLKACRVGLRRDPRTVEILDWTLEGRGWTQAKVNMSASTHGRIFAWWREDQQQLLTLALISPVDSMDPPSEMEG